MTQHGVHRVRRGHVQVHQEVPTGCRDRSAVAAGLSATVSARAMPSWAAASCAPPALRARPSRGRPATAGGASRPRGPAPGRRALPSRGRTRPGRRSRPTDCRSRCRSGNGGRKAAAAPAHQRAGPAGRAERRPDRPAGPRRRGAAAASSTGWRNTSRPVAAAPWKADFSESTCSKVPSVSTTTTSAGASPTASVPVLPPAAVASGLEQPDRHRPPVGQPTPVDRHSQSAYGVAPRRGDAAAGPSWRAAAAGRSGAGPRPAAPRRPGSGRWPTSTVHRMSGVALRYSGSAQQGQRRAAPGRGCCAPLA